MQSHRHCRFHDLFVGDVRFAVADVFLDGAVEQPGVLQHHTEQVVHVFSRQGGDVHAVHVDLAAVWLVKAHQQVNHGGLARAGGSDDRDLLSGQGVRGEPVHDLTVTVVAEAHVVKHHVSLCLRQQEGLVAFVGELLVFQKLKHPLACRRGGLQGGERVGKAGQRVDKQVDVHNEGNDHAKADLAAEGKRAADDRHRHKAQVAHKAHQRHHHAGKKLSVPA